MTSLKEKPVSATNNEWTGAKKKVFYFLVTLGRYSLAAFSLLTSEFRLPFGFFPELSTLGLVPGSEARSILLKPRADGIQR